MSPYDDDDSHDSRVRKAKDRTILLWVIVLAPLAIIAFGGAAGVLLALAGKP